MYNPYCLSSYLSIRFIYGNESWTEKLSPSLPQINNLSKYDVNTSDEIISYTASIISKINLDKSALLLSGGIDSAIIGSFLPEKTKTYTIRFIAKDAVDETHISSEYAKCYNLEHSIIDITFQDYLDCLDILIESKKSPLHPVEPALYIASKKIKEDGYNNILTGCNADGTFGGLDGLLSKDWTLDEFINRYSFVDYKKVLREYYDMRFLFKKYLIKDKIDVEKFIKEIFGYDTYLAFLNGVSSAGCNLIAPFAYLKLKGKLDLDRIRLGESKYLLREVFKKRYPNFNSVPQKIAFARPMDQWLKNWEGPSRIEFKHDINISNFSGNQKWLIYCLEYFLNYFDS